MRCGVDEVCEGDEGGGEPDYGAVEADDEDLGVGEEGVGYVEVVGYEGAEPEGVDVGGGVGGWAAAGGGRGVG